MPDFLLSYKMDLISVHKGLENITCIIWHILNLYTCSYGYTNGLISYLAECEVDVARFDLFFPTFPRSPAGTPMLPVRLKVKHGISSYIILFLRLYSRLY